MNITIPASMRQFTQGKPVVQATGTTVRELITDLDRQYSGFKDRVCDDNGKIRKFIAVFVNGRDIRTLQSDDTPLTGTEEIVLVAAIAGG
jgi:molybdopterin synthase sulfur carrier subunit